MELFILVDTSTPQQYLSPFYGRLNPASGEVTASLYYRDDFDYGFPSIAAFGENETDTRVLINFLQNRTHPLSLTGSRHLRW